MFSVFKQRNLQIPTRSPIRIGFRWLNHQVHQWSRLNCKPIQLVIHPNCLWSHNSERGSDHFWRNGFLRLRNLRTDQFFRSLLSSSKFVNSISHPLLSDSISKRFVQRYIERLKKEAVTVCHSSFKWVVNKQALSPPQATDPRTFTFFVVFLTYAN